jgi:colanic acid/amylovoran biosynthesis protein
MVVAGMGSVTDAFTGYALDMLGRIEFALDAGVPVVMVGQGIGPIDDLILRQRAAEILRRVSFISLREGRAGPQLLHALGVSSERVMVTGDDAIELAFESRAAELGRGLGVNLRTADYAQLRSGMVDQFRPIVQDAAQKYSAPLISIPIDGDDLSATTRLLSGYGESAEITAFVNDPQAAFEQVKSCRATMTGSYHAAVFSLSLGTPAVCVAASAYYADKFLGLAEQFGQGCEVVLLRKHDWPKLLAEALDRTWYSADRVRPKLLARAQNQIALGHAAYQRIHSLIESNVRFVGAHNL